MSQLIPIVLVAAVIFGICYLVDKTFAKLFRSKAQHRSGLAVRANKRYGIFGVILTMLGIIIGIGAVIGILTVGTGLTGSITGSMSGLGASNITVSLRKLDDGMGGMSSVFGLQTPDEEDMLTADMLEALRTRYGDYIVGISLNESAGSGQAKDGRLYANLSISGVNEDYQTVNNIEIGRAHV